jgi:HTH-type transcriptional regulator/antitoxin HigA
MMDLKPIKTEQDYEAALQEIDRLWEAKPDTPEGDKLEILVTLVEAYEHNRYELPPPDAIEALAYFMESRGWTCKDLVPYLGSRGRVSEILSRKRPLTLAMIRKLAYGTGIPASILIQPYETEQDNASVDADYRRIKAPRSGRSATRKLVIVK